MEQRSMEGILRRRKHPHRWMPAAGIMRPRTALRQMADIAGRILPSFLLAFADMLGIPSGLHAAYMGAMAAAARE